MNLRSSENAITNEVCVYELVAPKFTTYRTTLYRTKERALKYPIESKREEIFQNGEVPPPMYASTFSILSATEDCKGVGVLVGGIRRSNEDANPIQLMMGTKSLWNEESSGEIFVLEFDLVMKSFVWKKIPLVIQ